MVITKKVAVKKNMSSIQVLKTLQILLQGNFSMSEIMAQLNTNENRPMYCTGTISKYINTCRACGIHILKVNNKYIISNMPFGLNLSYLDTTLLENLQNVIQENMASKYNKIFNNLIEKINRYSNKNIINVGKKTYHLSVELFERAIKEKRKIKLIYKNKVVMNCIPLNIVNNSNKLFFHIMYQNTDRMIDIERISAIDILNEKYIQKFNEQVVVYELKNDLAIRYKLRDNERLIKCYDGKSITIANHNECKEILFSRLLRYDDKCEIIHPKIYREEMSQIINSALSNYGEFN